MTVHGSQVWFRARARRRLSVLLLGMAEIRGKYVYDDDFTPGQRADGGLSQNLYDPAGGHVKGHATFIPDDESDYSDEQDYEPSGLSDEDRRRAEELGELIAAALVAIAIAAAPHVKAWWLDTAWPGIKRLFNKESTLVSSATLSPALALTELAEAEPADVSKAIESAIDDSRTRMSTDEAQRRLLAMLAASAFIAEQRQILSNARLEDQGELPELQRAMEQLASPDVTDRINRMLEANPSLLDERASAQFMQMFGGGAVVDGVYVPIRSERIKDAFHLTDGHVRPDDEDPGALTPV